MKGKTSETRCLFFYVRQLMINVFERRIIMRNFTSVELRSIIDLHEKWLRNETDGVRANLRLADFVNRQEAVNY